MMTPPSSGENRELLAKGLLVLVVLAASVKSYTLYASTLDATELMPQTIASGQANAPNQYRVLVPLLWKSAVALGIAPGAAERGVVVFSILFCYGALALVLYRASRSVPVTALCLIAFYGAAASGFWFRSRDVFFEAAFTAIGMDLVIQPRPRWLPYSIVSVAGSLNRETWLFSVMAAALSRWFDAGSLSTFVNHRRRDVIGLAGAVIVTIGILVAVRAYYGVRPYHYALWQYPSNLKLLLVAGSFRSSVGQAIWFAGSGMFAVWVIFALAGLARYCPFVLAFMGLLLTVSFFISNWSETRIFTSGYVVLLVSMSAGLASQPSPQARGSGLTTQPPRSASPPGRAE